MHHSRRKRVAAAKMYPIRSESFVHLVDGRLADDGDSCEELRDFLWRVVLAARLSGLRRVHLHEVLVGVAEDVDRVVLEVAEREVANGIEELTELGVSVGDGVAEFGAVDVEVVKEAVEIVL